jgi:hypothetical protein
MYTFTVTVFTLKLLKIVSSDLYCVHISSLLCDNIFWVKCIPTTSFRVVTEKLLLC